MAADEFADDAEAKGYLGGDDVHAARLGEDAEHVVDVGILEVEIDAAAGVALNLTGRGAGDGRVDERPRRYCWRVGKFAEFFGVDRWANW